MQTYIHVLYSQILYYQHLLSMMSSLALRPSKSRRYITKHSRVAEYICVIV